jgi:hypothetical protein
MNKKLNYLETLRAKAGLNPLTFELKSEKVIDDLIVYFEKLKK